MTHNAEAHPITVEVVRNSIVAYADEMANALCKSAYNMMIYEVRDFCCGLIDTQGRMISQNRGGLPIFLADLGVAVEDGIRRWGLDGFKPGDIMIMNHGEVCGQHLNNVVIYAPCFVDGELVAFAANRAHWVDIGGMRIGFGSSLTTEIFAEGLRIPPVKLWDRGRPRKDVMNLLLTNMRARRDQEGDFNALIGACQVGARNLVNLMKKYGKDVVQDCIAELLNMAEAHMRKLISEVPNGTYTGTAILEDAGHGYGDFEITATVTIKGDGCHIAIQSPPQIPYFINSYEGNSHSGVYLGLMMFASCRRLTTRGSTAA